MKEKKKYIMPSIEELLVYDALPESEQKSNTDSQGTDPLNPLADMAIIYD